MYLGGGGGGEGNFWMFFFSNSPNKSNLYIFWKNPIIFKHDLEKNQMGFRNRLEKILI